MSLTVTQRPLRPSSQSQAPPYTWTLRKRDRQRFPRFARLLGHVTRVPRKFGRFRTKPARPRLPACLADCPRPHLGYVAAESTRRRASTRCVVPALRPAGPLSSLEHAAGPPAEVTSRQTSHAGCRRLQAADAIVQFMLASRAPRAERHAVAAKGRILVHCDALVKPYIRHSLCPCADASSENGRYARASANAIES